MSNLRRHAGFGHCFCLLPIVLLAFSVAMAIPVYRGVLELLQADALSSAGLRVALFFLVTAVVTPLLGSGCLMGDHPVLGGLLLVLSFAAPLFLLGMAIGLIAHLCNLRREKSHEGQ